MIRTINNYVMTKIAGKIISVTAVPALQSIISWTTINIIISYTAFQRIIAWASKNAVITIFTINNIIAIITEKFI